MDILAFDISILFTFENLFSILLGTFVGLIFGALPGLGALMAMIVLLPLTFDMSAIAAVLLLLAAYQSAEYGGSISAVTMGIPGTPAAAATVLDGHPYAKKEGVGKALAYSLTASTIGGLAGGLALIFLAKPFADFALKLSETEYFLIALIGLITVSLISKDLIKGLISMVLGLMLGTVGLDMFTGEQRFTMGSPELLNGIDIMALLVGVFAIPEIFKLITRELDTTYDVNKEKMKVRLKRRDLKGHARPISIGSITGIVMGIIPGLGSVTASWVSYIFSKNTSKNKDSYGKGNPKGITSAESSNNGAVASSLIPLFALGIPGNVAAAIVMGAFIIHGIRPGPRIFENESNIVYGVLIGFLLTTVAMYIVGKFVTSLFTHILTVSNKTLVPLIFMITIVGVFAANNLYFDLWVALLIGIVGYILLELNFSLPTLVISFILAPIIEESFRRALLMSDGSYTVFVTRPFSLILIIIIVLIFLFPLVKKQRERKKIKTS